MSCDTPTPSPEPVPEAPATDGVPRSGAGADTALYAMLKKRQMRAGAEPQPPAPDGKKKARKK